MTTAAKKNQKMIEPIRSLPAEFHRKMKIDEMEPKLRMTTRSEETKVFEDYLSLPAELQQIVMDKIDPKLRKHLSQIGMSTGSKKAPESDISLPAELRKMIMDDINSGNRSRKVTVTKSERSIVIKVDFKRKEVHIKTPRA